ncbi:N-acetylmuramoyl-L-alanine amidase [Marimonas arenosa]|uniref:N-acetylmuramoyl-L-alanine amidase n=1 Tax=Marimonas arenosa TaxID=1795305 RepID=A0AAE4B3C8_9RHOB|nr:N-acetylmuramoyl-L-alanine amidase [Marimonas arenosa]MDQ2089120.1 N-acetylmuramoyl-L-alanine amidase [Marimonas arenosa]
MSRVIRVFVAAFAIVLASIAGAQDFSGLARVDPESSRVSDLRSGLHLELGLSQGVPYRVYTLPDPDRMVLDFREVDWTGLETDTLARAAGVNAVRFGGVRPGWSRMVIDLVQPMVVDLVDLRVDPINGQARLDVKLAHATREAFEAGSVAPFGPDWGSVPPDLPRPKPDVGEGRLTVLIDPGHGGIDPGAEREGLQEKELMLLFAFDLRDALLRVDGVDVALTREDDRFVSLERRVAIAHQTGAGLFISLHADMLSEGRAHGAVVYKLTDQASDEASALLAERHNRADILAGVDLTGRDDVVADVLLDLARLETQPRTDMLARSIVDSLEATGVPLNRHPFRSAAFSVLKAADIPSVLLEVGFLSSDRDFNNLADPVWRRKAAAALRDGIQAWMITDRAARDLVRQ